LEPAVASARAVAFSSSLSRGFMRSSNDAERWQTGGVTTNSRHEKACPPEGCWRDRLSGLLSGRALTVPRNR